MKTISMLRIASTSPDANNVVRKWASNMLFEHYDALIRLQILEGALGVMPGLWSRLPQPRLGLQKAATAAAAHSLSSEWFEVRVFTNYQRIRNTATINGDKSKTDDIINAVLAGVTVGEMKSRVPRLYVFGKTKSREILSGEMDLPWCMALVARMVRQQILSSLKPTKKNPTLDYFEGHTGDDGEMMHSVEPKQRTADSMEVIKEIMFGRDRLSRDFHTWLRQAFDKLNASPKRTMNLWLDIAEETHAIPSMMDLVKALAEQGITATPQTVTQRHWQPAWETISPMFKRSKIWFEIQAHFEALGLEAPENLSFADILVRKSRKTEQN